MSTPTGTTRVQKLEFILDVAKEMAAERDLDSLLPLILGHAASVVSADRCSLFILDRERKELWSKVAQGAKNEIRLPLGSGIAGSVAATGTNINIADAYQDDRFNRSFDDATGYRTRTIVCVPMRDAKGEVTGVIQALNKRDGTFTSEDEELLGALGGQAASAIENALLYEAISHLFEGFVSASVVAIEARDPSTAGHSGRVATLTVELAKATEHVNTGTYAGVRFTATQLREMRYASLLHDFGKVGVREPVLVKADKLYPHELEILKSRFQLARKDRELQSLRRRLDAVRAKGASHLAAADAEENTALTASLKELDEVLEFILACNRPTVLAQGGFEKLSGFSRVTYQDAFDQVHALISEREVKVLSIPRGSLSQEERLEIESHVTHTYRFLSQIPWTADLKSVPEIAWAHHEKLNGKGYPRAIPGGTIPVQSKMMTISDIYDALTASDRPYKKAVPHVKALDILKMEMDGGQIDPELFKVFVEAEIPRKALPSFHPGKIRVMRAHTLPLVAILAASVAWAGPNVALTRAEKLVDDLDYDAAAVALLEASKSPRNDLKTVLRILELQGMIAVALDQKASAQTFFRQLLILSPAFQLNPKMSSGKQRAILEDARNKLADVRPLKFEAASAAAKPGLVDSISVKVPSDPMTMARRVRFMIKLNDDAKFREELVSLAEGKATAKVEAESVQWYAELWGDHDMQLSTVGTPEKPIVLRAPEAESIFTGMSVDLGGMKPLALAAGGAALVAGGLGTYFGLRSRGASEKVQAARDEADQFGMVINTTMRDAQVYSDVANLNALAANVAWGAGILLAGGGIAIWVLDAPAAPANNRGLGAPKTGLKMTLSGTF